MQSRSWFVYIKYCLWQTHQNGNSFIIYIFASSQINTIVRKPENGENEKRRTGQKKTYFQTLLLIGWIDNCNACSVTSFDIT